MALVLVVDDSANIRRLIVDHLQKLGFKSVVQAEDANDAISKVNTQQDKGNPFTLILSDLNMPGPSGIDFLKHVRGVPAYKELPFLLITTESEKGAVLEAAMNGVSSYVVKPFTIETLTKKLGEAWRKHNG